MQEFNVALVSIGGIALILSLFAGIMRNRTYLLSEPMVAVLLGIFLGPLGLGWFQLSHFGDPFTIVEQFARLTVGLAVMAAALRLPRGYFRNERRSMAAVLLPGMIGMWLISGGLAYFLLDAPLWLALLIGAIITPTDPVLAGTIVTGSLAEEKIPPGIRTVLTAESGANDGLAYPFVFLPILLIEHRPGDAVTDWFIETVLWEVGFAVLAGAIVGMLAGWIESEARKHDVIEETSMLSVTVALTATVLGGIKLLGSDGILAAFVAGLLFNQFAQAHDRVEEQKVQETVLRLFTFPVFVLFGVILPVEHWISLGWAGLVLVVAVLLVRRLPMVFVFDRFAPSVKTRGDALFAAWFGPIGIAALFYAMVAHRLIGAEVIWAATSLVIASSILVHGALATPLTKLHG